MMTEDKTDDTQVQLPQGLYMVIVNFDNTQEAYKIYRK